MQQLKIVDLSQYRKKDGEPKKPRRRRPRKKGSVYSRGGKLWVNFQYMGERVREPSGLDDTTLNRKQLRKKLDLIVAEIGNGVFEFAKRFPHSRKKAHYCELEGRNIRIEPKEITFGDYAKKWFREMEPGMSLSQNRDYTSILNAHLIPYFGQVPFSDFWSRIKLKKFITHLKSTQNRYGKPLSGKRIQNIMIPLRVIVKDAIDEHEWHDLHDPFAGLKLPKARKMRIYPFNFDEWQTMQAHMLPWYRPYFDFAVQTGLRPSEQVALKWSDIDADYIHIERSRVRNREKADLKTEESRRMIELRPSMRKALEAQNELTLRFQSEYVFINTKGRPILQCKLREVWARAMQRSGLRYRRMYETRHTFASWALGAGEMPEWVARTLGHVNTAMIYKTYGRYIRNLTRQDGSAFERLYANAASENCDQNSVTIGHNHGHNGPKLAQANKLNY